MTTSADGRTAIVRVASTFVDPVARNAWRIVARLTRRPDRRGLVTDGMRLGRGVRLGRGTYIDRGFARLVTVDDGARLGADVIVLAHDASTKRLVGLTRIAPVRIGRRARVGAGSIVLAGVEIGDDAVVLPDSVVTSDVPAGSTAGGRPARVVAPE